MTVKKADGPADPVERQVALLDQKILPLAEEAGSLEITSGHEYTTAAGVLKDVKDRARELEEARRSATRPLDEAKKRIMDWFRVPEARLKEAERTLKGAMLDFQNLESRRLREAADAAEVARAAEQARLAKLAASAEKKGQTAKATALQTLAESLPPAEVEDATVVSGISTRTLYKAEVFDFGALLAAIVAGDAPVYLVEPNMVALNKLASAGRGEFTLPGVRATSTQSMAAGR